MTDQNKNTISDAEKGKDRKTAAELEAVDVFSGQFLEAAESNRKALPRLIDECRSRITELTHPLITFRGKKVKVTDPWLIEMKGWVPHLNPEETNELLQALTLQLHPDEPQFAPIEMEETSFEKEISFQQLKNLISIVKNGKKANLLNYSAMDLLVDDEVERLFNEWAPLLKLRPQMKLSEVLEKIITHKETPKEVYELGLRLIQFAGDVAIIEDPAQQDAIHEALGGQPLSVAQKKANEPESGAYPQLP